MKKNTSMMNTILNWADAWSIKGWAEVTKFWYSACITLSRSRHDLPLVQLDIQWADDLDGDHEVSHKARLYVIEGRWTKVPQSICTNWCDEARTALYLCWGKKWRRNNQVQAKSIIFNLLRTDLYCLHQPWLLICSKVSRW